MSSRNAGVVADHEQRAAVGRERRDQGVVRREVEVVGRLVEQQQLRGRVGQQQRGQGGAEPLAAGQVADRPVGGGAAEQEARQPGADRVRRRRRARGWRRCRTTVSLAVEHVEPLGEQRDRDVGADRARARRQVAGDGVEQRGLARRRSGRPRATRSGPRRSSSTEAPVRITSASVVSTTRPRGTSVAGQVDPDRRGPRAAAPRRRRAGPARRRAARRGPCGSAAADFSARFFLKSIGGLAHVGRAPRCAPPWRALGEHPLGLDPVGPLPAQVGPGRGHRLLGGLLLGPDLLGVRREAAAVPAHRAVAQLADPVHPLEQLAVVADHEQRCAASAPSTS